MKKKLMVFIAIVVMAGFALNVRAQGLSDPIQVNVGATILTPITLSSTATNLNFGSLAVLSTGAGTCILDSLAARTPTGDVNLSSFEGGQVAIFTVAGEPSRNYAIQCSNRVMIDDGLTPADTMGVNLTIFTANRIDANTKTAVLNGSGAGSFRIGGTLHVWANQTPGVYTGSFDVTVAYF